MNFFQKIVDNKRDEVATRRQKVRLSSLEKMEYFHRTSIPFRDALTARRLPAIIAEIKRASPLAGELRSNLIPEALSSDYEHNGAAAISIVTDEQFFQGSLRDLQAVRQSTIFPLLRKDFIIHEYQLYEAKAYGADAVLLIAAILGVRQLRDLWDSASELGLECIVELRDISEIAKLDLDRMKLLGINNRDLRTFTVDLQQSITMAPLLPKGCTIISESGINSSDDLIRIRAAGIHAALIGEHLLRATNPGAALRSILDALHGTADC